MGFWGRQQFTNPNASENWLKITGYVPHILLEKHGSVLPGSSAFLFQTYFTYIISFNAHGSVTQGTDIPISPCDGWELKLRE